MTATDKELDVFHPMQRLCPDILAEIFTVCLPDVHEGPLWEVKHISSREAPLLLCSVCSSWRSLAISTPRLWQTLHLNTSSDKLTIDTKSVTNSIRTWLDRSRALPLSIRAFFGTVYPESDDATRCRLILEILSQEASRWESFKLHENGLWVIPLRFGTSPLLHTFEISGLIIDGIIFTAAPRLKRLSLQSFCCNPTSISGTPWDQLVELDIRETQTIFMVIEIIRRCPRLESLCLWVGKGDEDHSLTFRSITQHDTLRRLRILSMLHTHLNVVTDRLTLPALTDLSLNASHRISKLEAKFCCSQLVDFFTRSNCGLQELTVSCYGFGPGEQLKLLSHRSCQTLTSLLIGDDDSNKSDVRELLNRLTYPDGDDDDDDVPLCPKLNHLKLVYSHWSPPGLLGRMIQSRCFGRTQDTQLRSLKYQGSYFISKEDYDLLQFAKSNGGLELGLILS